MNYVFHFGVVWDARDELLWGAALTLRLSALTMVLSLIIAVAGAFARNAGPAWLRALVAAYVELIRNTPFLVQIFMIFFGLPTIGLRLDANTAALIAMTMNGSAYTIEIVRAGIDAVSGGQIEAAIALGLRRLQTFRLVVLPQALRTVLAPLCSQFILVMLNSSVCSVISADELTAAAEDIQARTFRAFEAFIAATIIYFVLSMLFTALFAAVDRFAFARGEKLMRELGASDIVFVVLATRWTILLSAGAFVGGGLIGAAIALLRLAKGWAPRSFAIAYIRVFQGTPLLLQLFLVFFGGDLIGLSLGPWLSAILGLSLNAGAFLGEIWRGALQSVPKGQTEAARALGLHALPRLARVVLPQALRVAIPPTVGFLVNLIKSTSLAAIIGFVELTRAGQMLNNSTFHPFAIFSVVAAVYFLLCWPLSLAARGLERRLAIAYTR